MTVKFVIALCSCEDLCTPCTTTFCIHVRNKPTTVIQWAITPTIRVLGLYCCSLCALRSNISTVLFVMQSFCGLFSRLLPIEKVICLLVRVYTSVTLLMSCFFSLFIVVVVGFIGNVTVNARESVGSFDVEVGIIEGIIGQTDSNILVDISAVDGTAQSKNINVTIAHYL